MTITFDRMSSRHKAIIMCDGILEQNKWVTFWPCHPSWSWLMGSLDAVMRRTLPLSRWKRHFELIEGIHDLKILGVGAQNLLLFPWCPLLSTAIDISDFSIFHIHPKRVEYNASLTDRTDRKNMTYLPENYFWSAAFQTIAKFSKVAIWHTACTVYVSIKIQK